MSVVVALPRALPFPLLPDLEASSTIDGRYRKHGAMNQTRRRYTFLAAGAGAGVRGVTTSLSSVRSAF